MIPPNSIFVDTSGWAAPVLPNTDNFAQMNAYSTRLVSSKRPLVTTSYVLSELLTLLTIRSRLSRTQILAFIQQIKQMSQVQIIHVDETTDAAAWAMLQQYSDKDWSLVDAASFVVMRQLALTEAFTSDHHFTQAGFVRVPQ